MTEASVWPAKGPLMIGWAALVILIAGFGGWAAFTPIAGAIVAPGQVDVERSRQVVQHPDGGRIDTVLVREGQRVEAGQALVTLDGAQLSSDLAMDQAALAESLAQIGRLEAERDHQPTIAFSPDLMALAAADPSVSGLMTTQRRLFDARAQSLRDQLDQLDRRRDQITEELRGQETQIAATQRQLNLLSLELSSQRMLMDKGLTTSARIADLEREMARLGGVLGATRAAQAEARSRIADTDLAIAQLIATRREQTLSDLRDLSARKSELAEKCRSLRLKIDALALRAPVAGVVMGLQISGPGSVLRPADPVLYIIPENRALVVVARVAATDIDEVAAGQAATLRIAAFDSRKTPDLEGRLASISADVFFDQQRGSSYYRAEIEIPAAEVARLGRSVLVPGMPAEVFLRTRDRTPLSYFLMPIENFFHRALRET